MTFVPSWSCSALLRATRWLLLPAGLAACAAVSAPPIPQESRLRGDTVALLGEIHDNADAQRSRLAMLRRALADGWRPAIAMEQFDIERQSDIDRARREAPRDAQHVIDAAASPRGGWDWALYRPVVALALDYELPLLAANLSGADTTKIVRSGYASVFAPARVAELGLDVPVAADWQAAQEREIDAGHCGLLPAAMWPAMARAQFARDAVMAALLMQHADHGIVLIAGNGHARRDLGVPRRLAAADQRRVLSIGFLEPDSPADLVGAFDAVVHVPPAPRSDPCEAMAKRRMN
jgi:uncharacterized iron-regulated protein